MVIVLASSAVDRVFKPRSGQTKDYKFNICCLSTQHKEKETRLVGVVVVSSNLTHNVLVTTLCYKICQCLATGH
jgi:hypothetical protein